MNTENYNEIKSLAEGIVDAQSIFMTLDQKNMLVEDMMSLASIAYLSGKTTVRKELLASLESTGK